MAGLLPAVVFFLLAGPAAVVFALTDYDREQLRKMEGNPLLLIPSLGMIALVVLFFVVKECLHRRRVARDAAFVAAAVTEVGARQAAAAAAGGDGGGPEGRNGHGGGAVLA